MIDEVLDDMSDINARVLAVLSEALGVEGETIERATTKIQANERGRRERESHRMKKRAAVKIQASDSTPCLLIELCLPIEPWAALSRQYHGEGNIKDMCEKFSERPSSRNGTGGGFERMSHTPHWQSPQGVAVSNQQLEMYFICLSQANVRGRRDRKSHRESQDAAVVIQAKHRGRRARAYLQVRPRARGPYYEKRDHIMSTTFPGRFHSL